MTLEQRWWHFIFGLVISIISSNCREKSAQKATAACPSTEFQRLPNADVPGRQSVINQKMMRDAKGRDNGEDPNDVKRRRKSDYRDLKKLHAQKRKNPAESSTDISLVFKETIGPHSGYRVKPWDALIEKLARDESDSDAIFSASSDSNFSFDSSSRD